ncbi:MAG: hypothetical protein LKM36_10480 [Flavobacteriales bacterium]|jgi:hypothetical protein|nr:hypothetical protein [Flavobacteriales bacterium]MCI1753265.1 hypothetical protein [Flavobacteriales bacterium]
MEKQETGKTNPEEVKVTLKPANPTVQLHGIPGFHGTEEAEDHARMANMELDKDEKGRVDTGTGDQPSNSEGSRFATPDH